MMDETPALYYAQAAWAFQHGNTSQGNIWVANAGNLYPDDLNRAFVAPFADLGWLGKAAAPPVARQTPPVAGPRPGFRVAVAPRTESPDAQVLVASIPETGDAPFEFNFGPNSSAAETPATFLAPNDEVKAVPKPEAKVRPARIAKEQKSNPRKKSADRKKKSKAEK